MKVFISWSGRVSKEIGEAFRDWLPGVLQAVKPYFTPADIEKGSRWGSEIAKELEQSKVGIFLLTKDNIESQWMMYEAGAISKTIDKSKVCPILFGLENSDVKGPLLQFQTSEFNKVEIKKLLKTINSSLEGQKLEDKVIDDVYEMWWPKLETKVNHILSSQKKTNETVRDDRELLQEILELSRLNARNSIAKRRLPVAPYDVKVFEELVKSFLVTTENVFDDDWGHTKACLDDGSIFISEHGTFLNPAIGDEDSNWHSRGTYLGRYRKLSEFIYNNGIGSKGDEPWDIDDLPF